MFIENSMIIFFWSIYRKEGSLLSEFYGVSDRTEELSNTGPDRLIITLVVITLFFIGILLKYLIFIFIHPTTNIFNKKETPTADQTN